MLERKKQFNSSLHNVSKKRLAEIQSGTYKPKKAYKIAKVSKKSASQWTKARRECLKLYDNKCFLCGATGELHCHHWRYTRTQRPDLKYDQDNLCILCSLCHNHTGADKRFYELQTLIKTKKRGIKWAKC